MVTSSRRAAFRWAHLIVPFIYVLGLTGCASTPPKPMSLAQQKELATRDAYRQCFHDALREAWSRKWDEQYMAYEIEQVCSERVGRPHHPMRMSPRLSLY